MRISARLRLLPLIGLLALTLGLQAAPAVAQDAAPPAAAQDAPKGAAAISQEVEDDKGFITRLLERNLSSTGRQVTISGFQGALSSRATFQRITISDAEGPWLTLNNGAIQWNRSALLQRRIEIAELSAESIDLPRLPQSEQTGPRAEARSFSLPSLPVSIDIQHIAAQRVNIGQPVFGEAAAVSLEGSTSLAGGEGAARLTINRVDGKQGVFAIDAGYSNDSRVLRVDLSLDEEPGGIFANLVNLEGHPAVAATIKGEGPIDDFAADISLATAGQPRITGNVALKSAPGPDGAPGKSFRLRVGGDVAALVPEQQRAFFGSQTQLLAQGWRSDSGQLDVPVLLLDTNALNISGSLATNAQNAPTSATLMVTLGRDAGATELPVRLPTSGAATTVNGGRLQLTYDAAQGSGWTLQGHLDDFAQTGLRIAGLDLNGSGTVALDQGKLDRVDGTVRFDTQGIAPADPGLAAAIGPTLKGQTGFEWTPGSAVSLSGLDITGSDYGLKGDLALDGLSSGLTVGGRVEARYDDLSRLARLAGQPLQGRATATVDGRYTLLGRGFDAKVQVTGTDIRTGQPQLDRLLTGDATITADAVRDETGITLRDLTVDGQRLTAKAQGTLTSTATDLTAHLNLASLAEVDPSLAGTLQADARLTGPTGQRQLVVNGQAVDLSTGIEALDGALQGQTELAVNAHEVGAGFILDQLRLANPQLTVQGQGNLTPGQMDATLTLAVDDFSQIRRDWAGSFTADGRITEAGGARHLTLNGTGEGLRFAADAGAALPGTTRLALDATQATGGDAAQIQVDKLEVTNDQLNVTLSGPLGKTGTNLSGKVDVRSLSAFGQGWRGSVQAEGSFADTGAGGRLLDVTGTARDVAIGRPEVDGLLDGETRFTVRGTETDGRFAIETAQVDGAHAKASATGTVGGGATDVTGTARIDDLARLGRGLKGSVEAQGRLTEDGSGQRSFDVTGTAQDLALGRADVDGALTGATRFTLRGTENAGAITLSEARVANDQASIDASGKIGSAGTDLRGTAQISRLESLGLGYRGSVDLTGSYADDGTGQRRIDVSGTGQDLAFGQKQADAALTGTTRLTLKATQGPGGFVIDQADLTNDQANVTAQGRFGAQGTDLTGRARVKSLAPFGPGFGGALDLTGSLKDDGTGARRLQVQGTATDLALGQPRLDGVLKGQTRLDLRGVERNGVFTIEEANVANPQATATASGTLGAGATDARVYVEMPSLAPVGPGWRGAVSADATLTGTEGGARRFTLNGTGRDLSLGQTQVDAALRGETRFDIAGTQQGSRVTLDRAVVDNPRLRADATGTVGGGATDLAVDLRADSIAFLGNRLRGAVDAKGQVRQQGDALSVTATGQARGLALGNDRVDPLLAGTTSFDVAATRRGNDLSIQRLTVSNPQLRATADGSLQSGIGFTARLSDLGLLAPGFPGAAEAQGTVRRNGDRFGIDATLTAPGGTRATVAGSVAQDFSTADIRASGTTDAAIANPFLRVRSVEGPVNFDLRLNGPPSLQALSGSVRLPDARLSDPRLGVRIEGLQLSADLGGGGITVDGNGRLADGGTLAVNGRIGLEGARPVDLTLRLDGATVRDPNLYEIPATGTLTVTGNLAQGPLIAGRLTLGTTEIRIPATGLGGSKDIPDITHLGERPPVRATRARAGLTPYPGAESREAGLAGPPATPPTIVARLDITIDAPNQVFVRGRGVDAEFGGTIRLTGNARQIVPVGYLQLIRGRVDLLGKRFDLTEGLLELQGSLVPVIRLVAETEQDGITTAISIEGEANDPKITFTSNPELPQEEVLSQLLFGRGLDSISALQAAQLANAVAVLAGTGGAGIVSELRNKIGLDDLDLATDDQGNVTVRAGKYLSKNLYSDVSVGGDGETKLNLNLDITKELTARGSIDNEGDSSVGVFFERDY